MSAVSQNFASLPTEAVAAALKALRQREGINLKAVGQALGVSAAMAWRYENAWSSLPFERFVRLADALGRPVEELISEIHGRRQAAASAAPAEEIARLLREINRPELTASILKLLRSMAYDGEAGSEQGRSTAVPVPHPAVRARRGATDRPLALTAAELGEAMAAQDGPMSLVYMPIVRAGDHRIVGFEALLRWTAADGHRVPPERVVEAAEARGMSHRLNFWVLQEACMVAADWPRNAEPLTLAVNVTGEFFSRRGNLSLLQGLLRRHGLQPQQLCIELPETVLLDPGALYGLRSLRELGVGIAIDDFGVGQANVARLREVAATVVKLDRSFFMGREQNATDPHFLRSMVEMVKAVCPLVLAEGIETEQDAALAEQAGCDRLQGMLFGPGMPAEEAMGLVAGQRRRATPQPAMP